MCQAFIRTGIASAVLICLSHIIGMFMRVIRVVRMHR